MTHLAAVAGSHDQAVEFCSYCGHREDSGNRVCSECGLGVRLQTDASVLRESGAAFLVVRRDGVVSAVSASAERLLAGRSMPALLKAPGVAAAVSLAAAGYPSPVTLPAGDMTVTVAPCGLPPAALVVVAAT